MSTSLAASLAAVHFAGPWIGFGWWFLFIPLFWILLFVILFAVFGRRWRNAAMSRNNPSRQAEATLGERYAQGDIDEVEYRKRLEVLRANSAAAA
jgi:putative membrane protein